MSEGPHDPGSPYQSPQADPNFPQHEPKPGGMPTKEECNSAMLAHLLGAFLGFLGPLIIYLTKKDDSEFVLRESKEALNFQLTMLIGIFATSVIGVMLSCFTFGLSGLLPIVPWLMQVIFGIVAALQANEGKAYEYPINFRMIQ